MNLVDLSFRLLQHRADVVKLCASFGWSYEDRTAPARQALEAISKARGCDVLQATIWLGNEVSGGGHDPSFVLAAGVDLFNAEASPAAEGGSAV